MSEIKLIDYAAMVKQFAGDNDLFRRFATRFINTYEKVLKDVENSFASKDVATIKLAIHKFKNLLCNFHAESVYKVVVEMEKLVVVGAFDSAKSKMDQVVKGTREIAAEIKKILENPNPMNL